MQKGQRQKIREEAAKLGTSIYKYVQPFIININEQIGKGAYGEVFKGADTKTGRLVAVKTICTSNIKKDPQKFFESLKNEIEIMKLMKHQNIVSLYDVKKSSHNIYMFQQLCDGGSLEQVLEKRRKLPESEVLAIMKHLISGYKYLHQNKVIHRDLKPANILIKDEVYKLADFGFAKFVQQGQQANMVLQSLVGSPMYMCPQILNGENYSTKSDVWSMGVIFYQMLFGRTPFKAQTIQQLVTNVNKKVIKMPHRLNNQAMEELLERMLKYDPKARISWKDIFIFPLFVEKKINDIECSMQMAKKVGRNQLQVSTKVNQLYFGDKKIINNVEIHNNEEQNKQISFVESLQETRDQGSSQKDVYKSIATKHSEGQNKKETVRKIKNWFLFKRNKAVFLNHLSLKIHACFANEKLNIPLHMAEIFILVLSKWQCMITYKSYRRLKQGKINSKFCTDQQYQIFMKSSLKDKLLQKFKSDFQVMKMFFDELVKKVELHLNKNLDSLPEKLKRVKTICNQQLCPKQQFAIIYNDMITELNEVCRNALKCDPKNREIIQLTFLVNEAKKLRKDELETNEFSMIYDMQEKLSNQDLIEKINGQDAVEKLNL